MPNGITADNNVIDLATRRAQKLASVIFDNAEPVALAA